MVDTAFYTRDKMTANPLGRMHAREPTGDPDGSLYPRRNIADFSHRATQFPRWAHISTSPTHHQGKHMWPNELGNPRIATVNHFRSLQN